jgi:MFS family permease
MDTVGAVLGPLIAIGLMSLLANDIRAVLWWAVLPGIVAVMLLIRLPEPEHARKPARLPLSREGLSQLGPAFMRLALLGGVLSLARFSEAFLVLRAADIGIAVTWVPLVMVVMSVVYASTAYPAGKLSDRMSRTLLLAIGMLVLVLADVVLAMSRSAATLFAGVALWGLHMGLTQGILASMIADVAPADHRGTAFGVFNLVSGLALLAASVLAGALWDLHGPAWTFWTGAGCALLTLLLIPVLGRPVQSVRS